MPFDDSKAEPASQALSERSESSHYFSRSLSCAASCFQSVRPRPAACETHDPRSKQHQRDFFFSWSSLCVCHACGEEVFTSCMEVFCAFRFFPRCRLFERQNDAPVRSMLHAEPNLQSVNKTNGVHPNLEGIPGNQQLCSLSQKRKGKEGNAGADETDLRVIQHMTSLCFCLQGFKSYSNIYRKVPCVRNRVMYLLNLLLLNSHSVYTNPLNESKYLLYPPSLTLFTSTVEFQSTSRMEMILQDILYQFK